MQQAYHTAPILTVTGPRTAFSRVLLGVGCVGEWVGGDGWGIVSPLCAVLNGWATAQLLALPTLTRLGTRVYNPHQITECVVQPDTLGRI